MKVRRFHNPVSFYARVEPFLLEHEAEHNLLFGILNVLIDTPEYYPSPLLALVESGRGIEAVALQTPPHKLILSLAPEAAVTALAESLKAEDLPGITALKEVAATFAGRWQELTGRTATLTMPQRIYRLRQVQPVDGTSGNLRQVAEADRPLLVEWFRAFAAEALRDAEAEDAERTADSFLTAKNRTLFVWERSGEPVSMAGAVGPTPNGIRINAVYTPPEQRRRGFASACVAALSQMMLEEGYGFCFLFTDLRNPTSNHIYQEIGYEAVADVDAYAFEGNED